MLKDSTIIASEALTRHFIKNIDAYGFAEMKLKLEVDELKVSIGDTKYRLTQFIQLKEVIKATWLNGIGNDTDKDKITHVGWLSMLITMIAFDKYDQDVLLDGKSSAYNGDSVTFRMLHKPSITH